MIFKVTSHFMLALFPRYQNLILFYVEKVVQYQEYNFDIVIIYSLKSQDFVVNHKCQHRMIKENNKKGK